MNCGELREIDADILTGAGKRIRQADCTGNGRDHRKGKTRGGGDPITRSKSLEDKKRERDEGKEAPNTRPEGGQNSEGATGKNGAGGRQRCGGKRMMMVERWLSGRRKGVGIP